MSDILFVSKPIAPPWNDGSKTLVRDLAGALTRHRPIVLGVRGAAFALPRGRVEPAFPRPNEGFGLAGQPAMRLAARLASGPRGDLWHFVFAPNPRTSRTARALCRLRRVPSVQTVASVPGPGDDLATVLFGDRVVVLSRRTEESFLAAGVAPSRLRRIAPCVAPLPREPEARARGRRLAGLPADVPIVLFPGDLERGRGAELVADAVARLPASLGAMLVVMARRKSSRAAEAERALRERVSALGIGDRTRWLGETPHVHAMLAAADVVALPATDLYAKIDIPIVLLEAVSLGLPVVVAAGSSAADLADQGGALAVEPATDALAAVIERLLTHESARAEQGRAALAASARYHPARMAEAYETLYDELVR
ncbi:MAG: glycosyltransferase family 4 protein [Sandaracinus sp.]